MVKINKKMNYFIRFVFALFICVMLSASITAKTYAKYITSEEASDSARVAKWGVNIEMYGSLFGTEYNAAEDNGIHVIDDGKTITVTSYNKAYIADSSTITNVVAPGTKNNSGLHFSLTGKPETAINLEITLNNQSVALRPNIYGIMHKVGHVTSNGEYHYLATNYDKIYIKNNIVTMDAPGITNTRDGYVNLSSFDSSAYPSGVDVYALEDVVEIRFLGDKEFIYQHHWPYCPVIYELTSSDANGLTMKNLDGNPWRSRNDKTLDIISSQINQLASKTVLWPNADIDNKSSFKRTFSEVYPAGTDLGSTIKLIDENLTWFWANKQYSDTGTNIYARRFDGDGTYKSSVDGYNTADTILGHLAAEKQGLNNDWEVVIHNRSTGRYNSGATVFAGYKTKNGNFSFMDGYTNRNNLADEWMSPIEYGDYCIETSFNFEIKVTQLD